jgi:hypothetical protein
LTLVTPDLSKQPVAPISQIKVLPFKEKDQWNLTAKYNIGKKNGEKETVNGNTA